MKEGGEWVVGGVCVSSAMDPFMGCMHRLYDLVTSGVTLPSDFKLGFEELGYLKRASKHN